MGFWKDHPEVLQGSQFVGAEEKAALADSGIVFLVSKVAKRDNPFEKDGFQYVLTVELDGEERLISFGGEAVETRDKLLDVMASYLEKGGEAVPSVLTKAGRSYIVRPAPGEVDEEGE